MATMPQITPSGVEALATRQSSHSDQEQKQETEIFVLQVLEVLRYVADPAVRTDLGAPLWNVFDVVVSDGVHTMACALDPTLNTLVWKGQLMPMDWIEVLDWSILDANDDGVRCVLRQVTVMRQSSQEVVVNHNKTTKVALERQKRALSRTPLLGGRQYYLPLLSDYYSDDWLDLDSSEDSANTNLSSIKWSLQREYCTDLFVGNSLRTIQQVRELVESTADASLSSFPPLVGLVQFKSSLKHLADPAVAHPFPFAFHLKLVDQDAAVEIMFAGSMCAHYFLSINDGDVVQLTDYSVDLRSNGSVDFFYEHLSTGYVRHVRETSWKLLETIRVLPLPIAEGVNSNGSDSPRNNAEFSAELPISILRLPWAFSSTLDTRYWPSVKRNVPHVDEGTKYFDFVGMVSFVGRIYRSRHRPSQIQDSTTKNGDGTIIADVRSFRFIKVIDRSSTNELVIKVLDCSQPSIFGKFKVGIAVVLTKLQWTALDSLTTVAGESIDGLDGLEEATTSEFSSLYMDDATSYFDCFEECRANMFFAKSFMDRHDPCVVSSPSGDSWLATGRYRPRHIMPAGSVDDFVSAFQLNIIPGRHLDHVCDALDAFSGAHVGVIGNLVGVELNDSAYAIDIKIELDDGRTVKATVQSNPFFKRKHLPRALRALAGPAIVALMRALPIDLVDKLAAAAESSTKSEPTNQPLEKKSRIVSSNCLSVDHLEQQLKGQEFLCSMHLYRNKLGRVLIEVDALLSTS